MEFQFEGKSVITLKQKDDKKSTLVAIDFNLDVLSKEVDKDVYINKEGLPTQIGTKTLTQCFIQGLVGNIHQAHENGYWDSAEHLRYIIAELERGFSTVAEVSKGNFKK